MHLIPLYISSIVYPHALFNFLHCIPSCLIDLLNMIFFQIFGCSWFPYLRLYNTNKLQFHSKNVSFLATLLTIRAIIVSIFLRIVSISLVTWYLMNIHSLSKISLIHNHHPTFTQTFTLLLSSDPVPFTQILIPPPTHNSPDQHTQPPNILPIQPTSPPQQLFIPASPLSLASSAHKIVTRSRTGILKPNPKYVLPVTNGSDVEPSCF